MSNQYREEKMNSVFEYTDYRKFLADFYSFKKSANKSFSHRFVQEKIGFKSAGHFSQILSGRANISLIYIEKIVEFLKLNKKEASYFQNMVMFNQSKIHEEKRRYFEKINAALNFNR